MIYAVPVLKSILDDNIGISCALTIDSDINNNKIRYRNVEYLPSTEGVHQTINNSECED